MSHSNEALIAINTAEDIRRARADVLDLIAKRLKMRLINVALRADVGTNRPMYMSRKHAVRAAQGEMSPRAFAVLNHTAVQLSDHEARALAQCCIGLVNDMRTLGLA